MEKYLNVISFNVPYPPNYGGMIDVYYTLKTLHDAGVKIILHTFIDGRKKASELDKICEEVYYYKAKKKLWSYFSSVPNIVYCRRSTKLIQQLLRNEYPILFECLHTCYYLNDPRLRFRRKMVRLHNIMHEYYAGLARNSNSRLERWFLKLESKRLKKYGRQLLNADVLFPLSTIEKEYTELMYPSVKTELLPSFHANLSVCISEKTKPFVLYHGDLSTPDNVRTALFLIKKVIAKDHLMRWVIAGLNPHPSICRAVKKMKNVEIQANLNSEAMDWLIKYSRVNIFYTHQVSGVRMKLINALFKGHHCLVNQKTAIGSRLESLCRIIPDEPNAILESIRYYFSLPFTASEVEIRKEVLERYYNNSGNAKKLLEYVS